MKFLKKKFFPTPLRVVFHSSELCLVVDQEKNIEPPNTAAHKKSRSHRVQKIQQLMERLTGKAKSC